ncbi:thioredoxin domain-containing protein [Stagnihabitans tardus]|uniref:Thioredoxin domain-containing protein n=1 Tax=Stagnihabitans tardus TaxID=2699202 RepID=A0AAE5BUD8_9RHOB|nr:thioredoxin domain-containing protein [Stagnihabitans tardus]NBZ86674.1 thioredoxin domain-containing protein [Stagnihabitans tardus]
MILTRRNLLAAGAATIALPALAEGETPAAPVITDMSIGSADAKVVIDEFLSFTCPHCANFHNAFYAKLKADYIDTGKLRLVYHEVYFDQLGLLGAMMARCGGEMKYFGITDMLLEKQRDWAGAGDLQAAVAEMKKFGVAAGMTEADIDKCLQDQAMAEAMVAHYQESIATAFPNDSFEGTPSFLLNGVVNKDIFEGMDYEALKAIIEAELAK